MRHDFFRSITAAALFLGSGATLVNAQDDDALRKLLEQVEPAPPVADDEPAKDDAPTRKPELDGKDKDLDAILKKLGVREDRPETQGKAPETGQVTEPDDSKGLLDPEDEDLDAHLRRLIGRIDPEQDEEQDQQKGQDGGSLAETMKKMREVEQRLSKLDTGEQTREQQQEVVKSLEQVLQRIQKMRGQQQQAGQQAQTKMAGQQRGQKESDGDPNSPEGGGAAPVKPKLPDQPTGLASAKDTWGHLQGSMREVIENASRMLPLQGKRELVDRYFLSVAKRGVSRSGDEE